MRSAYERTVALDVQAIREYTRRITVSTAAYYKVRNAAAEPGRRPCERCGRDHQSRPNLCRKCRRES
jgi:ribosomal protein S27AE